ncbi:MAG: phage protein Gp27 family protein, partial [Patescibacteria group bacterium]
LQEAEDADHEKRLMLMSKAARAIADLARASVSQKKWAVEIRQQERERAVQAVESEAKRQGASTATIDALRAAIMQEMGR